MPSRPADLQLRRDAARLHQALSDLVRVYQFRDRDRIGCHDVSVTQCYALEALVRGGPRTLNELAGELFLDKSTASRVVAALERKRYVARSPHPQDRRSVLLAPTASGRRLHQRISRELVAEELELVRDFPPKVREAAARLLVRLARAAERRSGVATARFPWVED
jgi:DNA-binding MarR family transcriptional regulator